MRLQVKLLARCALPLLFTALASQAGASPPVSLAATRIVNVTADSSPGWLPSVAQSQAATARALGYFAARDAGRAQAAFAMLDPAQAASVPYTRFERELSDFNSTAGPVIERSVVDVTWTKDPAAAPKSGIYAAIDMTSRFANISRECGYIVLYQETSGGPFRIMREETNFMTDLEAEKIERQQSPAAVGAVWSQLSARCPNYPGYSPPLSAAPLAEQASTMSYPTVAVALADIRSRPGFSFTTQGGYTIATDDAARTIWVFASEGQPAYPAALKRQIVVAPDGGASVEMSVLCEASKQACDSLVRTFEALNAKMAAALKRTH